jgi:PhnB protein
MTKDGNTRIITSIAPWLTVENAEKAGDFYKAAFGAVETYRLETPDGHVLKLSVDGADLWLSGGLTDIPVAGDQRPIGGDNVRMILTTSNPDALFDRALKAGASVHSPVQEGHGWRIGRLVDPFGLHW